MNRGVDEGHDPVQGLRLRCALLVVEDGVPTLPADKHHPKFRVRIPDGPGDIVANPEGQGDLAALVRLFLDIVKLVLRGIPVTHGILEGEVDGLLLGRGLAGPTLVDAPGLGVIAIRALPHRLPDSIDGVVGLLPEIAAALANLAALEGRHIGIVMDAIRNVN